MSASAIDLTGLYVSEQGRLQRFINRLVGNRATAEDLVQDAFLNPLRGVQATEIEHSRSYLTRTAKNLAIDHLRREKTQRNIKARLVHPMARRARGRSPMPSFKAARSLRFCGVSSASCRSNAAPCFCCRANTA